MELSHWSEVMGGAASGCWASAGVVEVAVRNAAALPTTMAVERSRCSIAALVVEWWSV